MNRYELPHGMRYSTLEEREEFYREEFNPDKVEGWFGERLKNTVFAVIIGRHTKIYPPEYEEDASTTILIDKYTDISDVKNQILEFRPESAYYDRNIHDEKGRIIGQELAFDLDPENFRCPIHGTLEDKMKRHQGLSFCEIELNMVKEETLRLYEELLGVFSHMRIVYSGRGFHIHVFDADTFNWSYKNVENLLDKQKRKAF